ncbi:MULTISPECIES: hypothetical protein [unclassified Streptomyces]|uniref:hypothetical protein n=1 Tax=unclassified Streptomyces TaxID=2593676 RepID=UPI00168B4148|nr:MULTISPECIES: hypothetical protein [unclassified Streptomyces]MBD3002751.1 hypothetical protein [Streptomyces sp. 5-10]
MDVRDDATRAPIPATAVSDPAPPAVSRRLRIITVRSLESGGQIIPVDMKPRPAFYGATS